MRVQLFPNESRGRVSKLIFGHVSFITLISSVSNGWRVGGRVADSGGGRSTPKTTRRWWNLIDFAVNSSIGAFELGVSRQPIISAIVWCRNFIEFHWISGAATGRCDWTLRERSPTIGRLHGRISRPRFIRFSSNLFQNVLLALLYRMNGHLSQSNPKRSVQFDPKVADRSSKMQWILQWKRKWMNSPNEISNFRDQRTFKLATFCAWPALTVHAANKSAPAGA